jgi:hypothetical protein
LEDGSIFSGKCRIQAEWKGLGGPFFGVIPVKRRGLKADVRETAVRAGLARAIK